MKKVKKIARYFLYVLIGLIIAMAVIPYVYKDEIIEGIKEAANQNMEADLDFSDIQLSLFAAFPSLQLKIEDIKITGRDTFARQELFKSEVLALNVHLPSLWSKDKVYQVNSIHLLRPEVNLIVLEDGSANYDIFPESDTSTTTSNFALSLNQYAIEEASLNLIDQQSRLNVQLTGLQHEGYGNMTATQFDLTTKSSIESLNLRSEGTHYMTQSQIDLDAIIQVDLEENTYSLAENNLRINELDLTGNGKLTLLESGALDITADIQSPSEDFSSYLSVVPYAFTKDFKEVKSSGKGTFEATIQGIYDSEKGNYPNFNINLLVQDAEFNYPGLPASVNQINIVGNIENTSKDLSDLYINLNNFSLAVKDQKVQGQVSVNKLLNDPHIKAKANGSMNLAQLAEALPLEQNTQLKGNLDFDVKANVQSSDLESDEWSGKGVEGFVKGEDIAYFSQGEEVVSLSKVDVSASDNKVMASWQEAHFDNSKINGNARFSNIGAFLLGKGNLDGTINVNGSIVDVNPYITVEEEMDPTVAKQDFSALNIDLEAKVDQFLYDVYVFENSKLSGKLVDDAFILKNLDTKIGKSPINLKGRLDNLSPYVNNEGDLKGTLTAASPYFALTDLIVEPDTAVEVTEIVPIPENLDMNIAFETKTLDYDGIQLNKVRGRIIIEDQVAQIHQATAKGLGGEMAFSGSYATPTDADPNFTFKYDLSQLQFSKVFRQLPSVQTMTPIVEYIDGFFNSTLIMDGDLGPGLLPKLNTLNASGFVETLNSSLKNFEVIEKLEEKLNLEKFKTIALDNTKNWIEISEGRLEFKPQKYSWNEIEVMVSGSHSLESDMDYDLIFKIPREKLAQNAVGAIANTGLNFLEEEAQKVGIDLSTGENIDLLVNIGGSIKKPLYSIQPLGSSTGGSFEENIQNAVEQQVNKEVEKARDSLNTVVKKTKESIKDTISNVVDKAIDSTKNKVNEKVEEAKKVVEDKAKKAGEAIVDSLKTSLGKDSLTNALGDKVIDIIGGKSKEEKDKIKDRLKDFNPFSKKKKDK
jgi:hypothetical protein